KVEIAALDQRGAEPELAPPDAERDHEDEDRVDAEDLGRQEPRQRDAAGGRNGHAHHLLGAEQQEASERPASEPRGARGSGHRPPCWRAWGATMPRHERCDVKTSSTSSRTAPCPPGVRVT